MDRDQPIPAFHFRVLFDGLNDAGDVDSGFQSISGLKISTIIPAVAGSVREGTRETTVFNPVVLRRAIRSMSPSPLREWVLQSLNHSSQEVLPGMIIEILNEEHQPSLVIQCAQVTAAGWELSELNASNSELLMEEISLQYKSIALKTV